MAPFTTTFLFPLLTLPLNILAFHAPDFQVGPSLCNPNATYKTYTQGVVDGPATWGGSCLASLREESMFIYQPYC